MRRLLLLVIVLFVLRPSDFTQAQEYVSTPIEISKEKVKIRGNIFYVHKVLHGQTLYSLAHTYGVTQEVIKEHNPSAKEGLKSGTIVYIPYFDTTPKPETVTTATNNEELRKEKETIVQEEKEEVKPVKVKYKKHTVKWYETIYDISNKYGVSVDAIAHLNNIQKDVKLKKRQVILIPDKNYTIHVDTSDVVTLVPPEKQEEDIDKDEYIVPTSESTTETLPDPSFYFSHERTYKISIILPVNASRAVSSAHIKQLDFYSGILLAFHDLRANSSFRKYHIDVIDLGAFSSVQEIIDSKRLENSELIIGPVIEENLSPVALYAKEHRIPVVSPLDIRTKNLSIGNPYFFLFPSIYENRIDHLLDLMTTANNHHDQHYLVISEKDNNQFDLELEKAAEVLGNEDYDFKTISYGILQGRGMDLTIKASLHTGRVNNVLVLSESEAFVSDVLRNLNLIQNKEYKINVYGMPKWKNFDIIELEYLHNLNTHLSLQYYVNYSDAATKDFISKYWNVFKSEPSPYSFQGYDILTYFLTELEKYGTEFPTYISRHRKSLLQSDVYFTSDIPKIGFINTATRNIVYLPNWVIKCY